MLAHAASPARARTDDLVRAGAIGVHGHPGCGDQLPVGRHLIPVAVRVGPGDRIEGNPTELVNVSSNPFPVGQHCH